jgi:hypothetical protein
MSHTKQKSVVNLVASPVWKVLRRTQYKAQLGMKFLVMPDGKARQVCSKVDSSYLIPGQHWLEVSTYLRFCTRDFCKVDIIFFLGQSFEQEIWI